MEDFKHNLGVGGRNEEVKVVVARQRLDSFSLEAVEIN